MVIDQRNAGASVTTNDGVFAVDRFKFSMSQASKGTAQQSSTAPVGFKNSLLFTSTSAYSVASGESFNIRHVIEGFNCADLGWGTVDAKTITVSFWVRSSLTGTFGGAIANQAFNRSYPFTYTINTANTWEYETITIAGDNTGTWNTDNNGGINIWIGLGVGTTRSGTAGSWAGADYRSATGATSVVGTNGATFYITGVQLEAGRIATPFEYVNYQTSLANCQRYCEVVKPSGATNYAQMGVGACTSTVGGSTVYFYQTAKRAQPTVTYTAANTFCITSANDSALALTSIATDRSDVTTLAMSVGVASGLVAGNATRLIQNNTASSQITISAEL
jgi:hypothetical protein